MEKTTYKTLELPIKLIQETEKIIQSRKANSFDEFVALALKNELLNLEQAENQIKAQKKEITEEKNTVSFYEAAKEYIGSVDGGPGDLATNKDYLRGIGSK
ncbi:conserved hypothetical protein [Microcystis aeruginosa PCC 9807]|uniref:Uncharacterized protein n=1 Tax=Microcystis aeruginosa PCC 9807 TaxID=1160283 RepID=I4H137_MICAE|nr:hypothetical protein [Microcystis aeruginosa]CCI15761.1 conserved hypothetical protein [Microcystis aeruginosa PCC 9807]